MSQIKLRNLRVSCYTEYKTEKNDREGMQEILKYFLNLTAGLRHPKIQFTACTHINKILRHAVLKDTNIGH